MKAASLRWKGSLGPAGSPTQGCPTAPRRSSGRSWRGLGGLWGGGAGGSPPSLPLLSASGEGCLGNWGCADVSHLAGIFSLEGARRLGVKTSRAPLPRAADLIRTQAAPRMLLRGKLNCALEKRRAVGKLDPGGDQGLPEARTPRGKAPGPKCPSSLGQRERTRRGSEAPKGWAQQPDGRLSPGWLDPLCAQAGAFSSTSGVTVTSGELDEALL